MRAKLKTLAPKTVSTAGTCEPLTASDLDTPSFVIQADPLNTGYIYIGDENVSSSRYAAALAAGESVSSETMFGNVSGTMFNLADVYVDTASNGNKACCGYLGKR